MTARPGLGGAFTALVGMFGRGANQILALAVTLMAARWLTPLSFGEFAIAAAFATLSRALLYAGAFEYLLKAPKGEEANTECLVVNLALATGMGALLAVISLFAGTLFHSRETGAMILALAPSSLLSAGANWQESQLLRSGRLKTYYGVTTFAECVTAAITIALILRGFGLIALVAQIYCRLIALVLTYRALQRPTWSRDFSLARARQVATWSSARYGATLVGFLSNYSADILLGIFLSPGATGLFRASHRMVSGVGDLIGNPTRLTATTIFSRRAAEGLDSGELWPKIAAATALLGWTAMAGLAAISSRGVALVLGPQWAHAGPIVAILCLQRAFNLIDGTTGPLLVAYSHVRALFAIQFAVAVAGVLLLFVMAPFGVGAAAVSTVIAAGCSTLLLVGLAARSFSNLASGAPRVVPAALVPAAAAGLSAWGIDNLLTGAGLSPAAVLASAIAAGIAAFAVAVLALRRRVLEVLQALNPPPARRAGQTQGDRGEPSLVLS